MLLAVNSFRKAWTERSELRSFALLDQYLNPLRLRLVLYTSLRLIDARVSALTEDKHSLRADDDQAIASNQSAVEWARLPPKGKGGQCRFGTRSVASMPSPRN
jgi:hypothetical protein